MQQQLCEHVKKVNRLKLAFPTGRDSATFWDKGTTGQAQNILPWDGMGQDSL